MKLYLSSYRVPTSNDLCALIGKPADQTKVAILPNAKDYYSSRVQGIKANEVMQYFRELGYSPEVVDLKGFDNAEKLKKRPSGFHLIWVNGGNTFCIRYEMRRSGFENVIGELLKQGIVYGGESAGAIVAGISLRDVEAADEPEFAEEIIWEGLNLVSHYILPHIGNVYFEEANNIAKENHKNDPALIELTDYQALVVDGSKQHITTMEN